MKSKEAIRRLEREGWFQARSKGGHRQFQHPDKPGARVTVPYHSGDISPNDLRSIYLQAGWGKMP